MLCRIKLIKVDQKLPVKKAIIQHMFNAWGVIKVMKVDKERSELTKLTGMETGIM